MQDILGEWDNDPKSDNEAKDKDTAKDEEDDTSDNASAAFLATLGLSKE